MEQQFKLLFNRKIDLSLPLSRNLTLLDSIVKELSISPTSHTALSAYQAVCKEYLGSKNPQSSSQHSSSPLQYRFHEINDPEMFGHFSFAKKETKEFEVGKQGIKPQRLFVGVRAQQGSKKGKSQDVNLSKNQPRLPNRNYVSNFQLPIVLHSSLSATNIENIKENSRLKLQEIEDKQTQLSQLIKKKVFLELIRLIEAENMLIRYNLKKQSALFLHHSKLLQRAFCSLANNRQHSQRQWQSALEFDRRNHEAVLQQYFLEWKERAMMTQPQRAFEQSTHKNYERLCRIRLIRNLQSNHKIYELRQDHIQEFSKALHMMISQLKKKSLLKRLSQNYCQAIKRKGSERSLVLLLQKHSLLALTKTVDKFAIFRQQRQDNKVRNYLRWAEGSRLIKTMQAQNELKKAYWKYPSKIILLKMMLEAIRDSMLRKGFSRQDWMEELPICLERTDGKLKGIGRRYEMSKVFHSLRGYLLQEKSKAIEVSMIYGKRVLKQLLSNYKLSILSQKEDYQLSRLNQAVTYKKIRSFFLALAQNRNQFFREKQIEISMRIKSHKIQECFSYLRAYKITKDYYQSKVQQFQDKCQFQLTNMVFQALKRQTLTTIINKKICSQFESYRSIRRLQLIFSVLKQHASSEKDIKRKASVLRRLQLSCYFQRLTFNMRVSLYGGYKCKQAILQTKQAHITNLVKTRRISSFFSKNRKERLRRDINRKIDQEYAVRFAWKVFNNLKLIAWNRKNEEQRVKAARQQVERKIKQATFDRLLNYLLTALTVRNVEQIGLRSLMRMSLKAIQGYSCSSSAIIQLSKDQIDEGSDIQKQ